MDTVIKRRLELIWPKKCRFVSSTGFQFTWLNLPCVDQVNNIIRELQIVPNHILNTHDLELINTEKDLRAKTIRRIVKRYYEVTVTVY